MPKQTPEVRAVTVADLAVPPRAGGYGRGDKTREDILRAALGLLVEDGYRALSMRRVAAACGMRLGNLTYHFPTREDLLRALFEAVIGSYEVEFAEIARLPGVAPEARLEAVCQLILEDIRTKKTTHLFPELWALSNHDAFVLERVQELYARARQPILEAIAAMRPDLDAATRKDLALFISASMEGLTVFAGHGKPFEARMPDLERIAIRSFLNLVRTHGCRE